MSHEHQHDHGHGALSDIEARVLAVESLLVEKGLIKSDAVDKIAYQFEHAGADHTGSGFQMTPSKKG
jgi:hypothetical protein